MTNNREHTLPQKATPKPSPMLQPAPAPSVRQTALQDRVGGKSRRGFVLGALLIAALALGGGAVGSGLVHLPGFGQPPASVAMNSPPIVNAADSATEMQATGDIAGRHYLGVVLKTINPTVIQDFHLQGRNTDGLLLQNIYRGGPADTSGLKKNDIILAIDGVPVRSFDQVWTKVRLTAVGDTIDVTVDHNGAVTTLPVHVGSWVGPGRPCTEDGHCIVEQ